MKTLARSLSVALILLVSGCAYTPPAYDDSKSEAANLAHSLGLRDIRDDVMEREDYERGLVNTAAAVTGDAASLVSESFGAGMSMGAGVGIGLLSALLEPPKSISQPKLMGWIAEADAPSRNDARDLITKNALEAVRKTLNDMELSFVEERFPGGMFAPTYYFRIDHPEWGCDASTLQQDNRCWVRVNIQRPTKPMAAPEFANVANGRGYQFWAGNPDAYSRIDMFVGSKAQGPKDQILLSISRHLPETIYLYMSPGSVQTLEGDVIDFPFILQQGDVKLFLTQAP